MLVFKIGNSNQFAQVIVVGFILKLKQKTFSTRQKKSGEYPEKNLGRCYPKKNVKQLPIKIWVDFTRYPSNYFSGYRLTRSLKNILYSHEY